MSQVTKLDIPEGAGNIVIFVHGFGVRWDSRGMFTDIQASLPNGWGSVLFDFYDIEGNDVFITPIDVQVERLQAIIKRVAEKAPQAILHIIAHSKGCTITALAQPGVSGGIIFLAPPETFGARLEKYFSRYPGAIKTASELTVPRKDGTTTHIPLGFFSQIQAVDAEAAMMAYTHQHAIHLLQTTEDEVLGKTTYKKLRGNPNLNITSMTADHNFTGPARQLLLGCLHKILFN